MKYIFCNDHAIFWTISKYCIVKKFILNSLSDYQIVFDIPTLVLMKFVHCTKVVGFSYRKRVNELTINDKKKNIEIYWWMSNKCCLIWVIHSSLIFFVWMFFLKNISYNTSFIIYLIWFNRIQLRYSTKIFRFKKIKKGPIVSIEKHTSFSIITSFIIQSTFDYRYKKSIFASKPIAKKKHIKILSPFFIIMSDILTNIEQVKFQYII